MELRDAGLGKETSAFSMINFLIVTLCVQRVLSNGRHLLRECINKVHAASHHDLVFPCLLEAERSDHRTVVLQAEVRRQLNVSAFLIELSLPWRNQQSPLLPQSHKEMDA